MPVGDGDVRAAADAAVAVAGFGLGFVAEGDR